MEAPSTSAARRTRQSKAPAQVKAKAAMAASTYFGGCRVVCDCVWGWVGGGKPLPLSLCTASQPLSHHPTHRPAAPPALALHGADPVLEQPGLRDVEPVEAEREDGEAEERGRPAGGAEVPLVWCVFCGGRGIGFFGVRQGGGGGVGGLVGPVVSNTPHITKPPYLPRTPRSPRAADGGAAVPNHHHYHRLQPPPPPMPRRQQRRLRPRPA